MEEWIYSPKLNNALTAMNNRTEKRNKTMPMIDATEWGLGDSHEPYCMPDGYEAKLQIIDVKEGVDKNGLAYLRPILEIIDEPYSKEVSHFLHIPDSAQMTPKQLNLARRNMLLFITAFEIDSAGPFDPREDWPGSNGWAILGVQTTEQYGDQNTIKKPVAAK